jgi:hypothetical protein
MAWLALSAPAAGAETASDSPPPLGAISSSVSPVAAPVGIPPEDAVASVADGTSLDVAQRPARAPATEEVPQPEPAGLLQAFADGAASSADQLISSVPLVNQFVPVGTVTTLTAPVVAVGDALAGDATRAILPAAGEALPLLDPVLEPLSGVVTGPVQSQLPVPGESNVMPALFNAFPPADDGRSLVSGYSASGAPLYTPSASVLGSSRVPELGSQSPGNGGGIPGPEALPAVPGSGQGSGQSSASLTGAAAWLSNFHMNDPLTGSFPVSGPLQNPPSPVSFDPGSSPD